MARNAYTFFKTFFCLHFSCFVCILSAQAATKSSDESNSCVQTYTIPPRCSGDDCSYMARWVMSSPTQMEVEVRHRADEGMWTAIGFSNNREMVVVH